MVRWIFCHVRNVSWLSSSSRTVEAEPWGGSQDLRPFVPLHLRKSANWASESAMETTCHVDGKYLPGWSSCRNSISPPYVTTDMNKRNEWERVRDHNLDFWGQLLVWEGRREVTWILHWGKRWWWAILFLYFKHTVRDLRSWLTIGPYSLRTHCELLASHPAWTVIKQKLCLKPYSECPNKLILALHCIW